jgi:para-nitrobenzyl esterase
MRLLDGIAWAALPSTAFARSGSPNNAKIPDWPSYSHAKRETMLFNNECRVVNDP